MFSGGELNYGACSGPSYNLSPLSNNSGSPHPADQINHQQGCTLYIYHLVNYLVKLRTRIH